MRKIFNLIYNEKHFFTLATIFFIIGSFIFKDYGISWDEPNERYSGFVSLNEVFRIFNIDSLNNYPELSNYIFKEYGVLFNLPLAYIEILFNIDKSKSIYLLRHYINFLIFFIATIYFYFSLRIFYNKTISIIGFIFLISSPRIFAESFYNNKDMIFLSLYVITSYYFIKFYINKKLINIIFFSLFAALSINIRVLGLLPIFILVFFLFLDGLNRKEKLLLNSKYIILNLILVSIFVYLIWPFLWSNPLNNILYTLKSMSSYDWPGLVFFLGEYHEGKKIPWNYSMVLFTTTTPLIIVILFLIGLANCFRQLFINFLSLRENEISNLWKNDLQLFNTFSLFNILIILIFIIEFESTLYGGWRHIYFLYPSIIVISLSSLSIVKKILNFKIMYSIIFFFLIINLKWLIQNHPYQFVYYNPLIKKYIKNNFELDHWGVSNIHSINYLLNQYDKDEYLVFIYSNSPYYYSLNLLNKNEQEKIKFVKKIDDAEFILTNHYYLNQDPKEMDQFLVNNYELEHEIIVNNVSINSIFKKK